MIKFYSMPPTGIPHPYLLVNHKKHRQLDKRKYVHAILDSGVSIFHKPNANYPPDHFHALAELYDLHPNIWVTAPDVPDDYCHQDNNIQRTIDNTVYCVDKYPDIKWLPVLQAKLNDVHSFRAGIQQVKELGLTVYNQRLAIGTVCKSNNIDFIRQCTMIAKRNFPKAIIHAFGLTVKGIKDSIISRYINSFDSMAYTFPRKSGGHSCRNKAERVKYWFGYLDSFPSYVEKSSGGA